MVKIGRILLAGAIALGGIIALSMIARAAAPAPTVVESVELSFPAAEGSTASTSLPPVTGRYIDLLFSEINFHGYTPVNIYPLKIIEVKVETTDLPYTEYPNVELSMNQKYRVKLPNPTEITRIEVSIVNPRFSYWFEPLPGSRRLLTVSTDCKIRADILA